VGREKRGEKEKGLFGNNIVGPGKEFGKGKGRVILLDSKNKDNLTFLR